MLSIAHPTCQPAKCLIVPWTSQGDLQILAYSIIFPLPEILSSNHLDNSSFPLQRLHSLSLSLSQEELVVSHSVFLKPLILTHFIVLFHFVFLMYFLLVRLKTQ